MKRCPKCNLQYDDSLRFCLEDGGELLPIGPAPTVAPETLVLPKEEASQPTITQAARPDVPPPQPSSRPVGSSNDQNQDRAGANAPGSSVATIIIGLLTALSLLWIILGFALAGSSYARRTPMILFCLIGTVFALIKAKRYRRASVMTALSVSVYLMGEFVYVIIAYGMRRWGPSSTFLDDHVGAIFRIAYLLNDLLYAAAIALLVAAIFASRQSLATKATNQSRN